MTQTLKQAEHTRETHLAHFHALRAASLAVRAVGETSPSRGTRERMRTIHAELLNKTEKQRGVVQVTEKMVAEAKGRAGA